MEERALDSELERTLRALASSARAHPPGSEEQAAISLAARALLYLHVTDGMEGFRQWLEAADAEASGEGPIRAFPSIAEALAWLEARPEAAASGSFVEVEHETYVIALGPTGSFVLVRTMAQPGSVGG